MDIKDYKDGKIIVLSKALDTSAKVLSLIYFFFFFISASLYFRKLILEDFFSSTGIAVTIIIVATFYMVAYRFLNKALMSEKLFVNKMKFQLIKQGIGKSASRTFLNIKISNFRHLNKAELSKHPLAGKTFDYLGVDTEQKLINEVHGANRLAFDYEGKTTVFGQDIYSWEFEELEVILYDITGNDFRYDDEFEKTIKSGE